MTVAIIGERPAWHEQAACRGDAGWLVDVPRGSWGAYVVQRAVCRGCPVAGACLAEALELTPLVRHNGVLRAGVVGTDAWRDVEAVVAELAPDTAADWSALATWLLDGDLAELDLAPIARRPGRRPVRSVAVVSPTVGGFMRLAHYDVKLAGRAFTKSEIVAARC